MPITFRTYRPDPLFGEDYEKLRSFLIRVNSHNYSFGRWDWMITHGYLDPKGLDRIGLWEHDGELVALATYDCSLGDMYPLIRSGYEHLLKDMLSYAEGALHKEGDFGAFIADQNALQQQIAAQCGYIASERKESDAVFYIGETSLHYTLPDGFKIVSMRDEFDLYKYGEVLWKGFNHEANGEGPFVFREEERPKWETGFLRPNVNLDLKIAVAAPDGRFVSYCGMWFDPACESALVEPVATDPGYRKMRLGKAAVLEGVRRCGELGAKRAYVGSSQQFYYSIGFRPYATVTRWTPKKP